MVKDLNKSEICFVLEGTYPYVTGGVADWVESIINSLEDKKFSVFYIGPTREISGRMRYEFPENVVEFSEVFLFENRTVDFSDTKNSKEFFDKLFSYLSGDNDNFIDLLEYILENSENFKNISTEEEFFELIKKIALRFFPDNSFLDLFWNFMFITEPLIKIILNIDSMPKARIYHAACTGYAGFAAAIAAYKNKAKFFLTEHGIYTRERIIDISYTNWIYQEKITSIFELKDALFLKKCWLHFFKGLSTIAYQRADKIFSITSGNIQTQIDEGAPENKIDLIPNGIDINRFSICKHKRKEINKVALIGRVVPIKDILTFLKSVFIVSRRFEDIQFEILGGYEENPEYYEICKQFVDDLGIQNKVKFLGRVKLDEKMHELDLVVLTSISEGLPLIILEAYSCGIPVVATDVGGCRDLIYGNPLVLEDVNIGKSGIVTEALAPENTGDAIIRLIEDKQKYILYSRNAAKRVETFYTKEYFIGRYKKEYEEWLV